MKLNSTRQITWNIESHVQGIKGLEVHFGQGPQPIQVALAESDLAVTRPQLKTLFTERKGTLNTLIIVVIHGEQASLFGPDADTEVMKQKVSTAEAILNSILDQPNEVLAYQRATTIWRSKQTTDLVGFTNNGLFASHYIRSSVNHHPQWKSAQEVSHGILNLREQELIAALGFEITSRPSNTFVLSAKGQDHRAVAILLDQSESFESKSTRLQASPVEWSLAIAAEQGAPWVIAIKDSQLRLYPAKDGVGVGQKSQAETYFEIDLLTIDEDKTGLLHLIFSADALAEGGTADELLANSRKFASELGVRLRERVYESVVPVLATEVANQLRSKGHELDSKGLQLSYELTLRILFRLLFQAYAEDRGLLPAGRNENFDKNSIKYWAQYLLERDLDAPYGEASTIWFDLVQVWDAIDQGNPDMQIPAYNGGLFGSNPDLHPEGALIRTLSIPDRVLGPALRALVIDDNTEDGVAGAVDFRSLSVREFGTIYEGLLESSLSVADQDLTVDSKGAWVPAKAGDKIYAQTSEVYFHSASGEREATGSYYTPTFIVDHLIERSVEPALNNHLARVKELLEVGDQAAAYKKFFDFRVADLAMGSAHFLVAAIDKIETVMRSFLIKPGNEIDGVSSELLRLEAAAKNALGKDEAAYAEIERASLLRRQIARRCVYGLDINPMAVELSRLAIWIHTFVPGLPMSSLEHNLVCANSLTGIGSIDEGLNALIPQREKQGTSLFDTLVENTLEQSRILLENVAAADEADKKEATRAAVLAKEARESAQKSKVVFDLAVANRLGVVSSGAALTEQQLAELHSNTSVQDLIHTLQPGHLPYLFPEVFLREDPGFDVVIGNPPWKEATIEEPRFWLRIRPGILGLSPAALKAEIARLRNSFPALVDQFESEKAHWKLIRSALLANPFPGLGTGDVDLYTVFAWKNLLALRSSGGFGLVFPRSLLSSAGSIPWRTKALELGAFEATLIKNRGGWAFESVGDQYTIALISFVRSARSGVTVSGPFRSLAEFQSSGKAGTELSSGLVKDIVEGLGVPDISSDQDLQWLNQLARFPTLSEQNIRFASEFHATNDRSTFDSGLTSLATGYAPVIGGKGFNLWTPLTGKFYAIGDVSDCESLLTQKLRNQVGNKRSAFYALRHPSQITREDVPAIQPRIVFRDIARASDPRTAIFSLVPANVYLTNKAPFVVLKDRSEQATFYHLGIFCSRIFDWQVKRFVEISMNFFILDKVRIPKFEAANPVHASIADLTQQIATRNGRLNFLDPAGVFLEVLKSIEEPNVEDLEMLDELVAQSYGIPNEEMLEMVEGIPLTSTELPISMEKSDG